MIRETRLHHKVRGLVHGRSVLYLITLISFIIIEIVVLPEPKTLDAKS
jgi:hypothetical protein